MQCFAVSACELERRVDPYYYRAFFQELYNKIHHSNYDVSLLEDVTSLILNGYDCREFVDRGRTYLRVSNIKPGFIDFDDVKFISNDEIKKDTALEIGDVILTRKGTFGVASVIDEFSAKAVVSSEVFRLKVTPELIPDYLVIWFNTRIAQDYFDRIKTGGIMGHISQSALKEFPIPIPPLKIQQNIVNEVQSCMTKAEHLRKDATAQLEAARKQVEKILVCKLSFPVKKEFALRL